MYVVIVTGLSGAGKSIAIKSFEDIGFYCVDNLPTALVPIFTDLAAKSKIERVALGIDIRERDFLTGLFDVLEAVQNHGRQLEILFLEAQDAVLVRRFSETRRKHPLAIEGSVLEGILCERQRLEELRQRSSHILDTSDFTVHELRAFIQTTYASTDSVGRMQVIVLSFGFKFGVPSNTDLVFDVRFLPNPHFDPELRGYTGQDPRIVHYVLDDPMSKMFLTRLCEFLTMLTPLYEKEGKSYLTISVGCTGGRHRSVVTAEQVGKHLRQLGYSVACHHRDLTK